jgi:hypothetical protein
MVKVAAQFTPLSLISQDGLLGMRANKLQTCTPKHAALAVTAASQRSRTTRSMLPGPQQHSRSHIFAL